MTHKKRLRILCTQLLAIVLIFSMLLPVSASAVTDVEDDSTEVVGNSSEPLDSEAPDPDEPTIILIRLKGDGALGAGYTTEEISEGNEKAAAYISALEEVQNEMAAAIDRDLFGGKGEFALEANYTIITNAFDATVRYGDVARIGAYLQENFPDDFVELYIVPEVQAIDPIVDVESTTHTVSASATEMVGANKAWEGGYTGAGQLIAVIDTGIEIEHPSFDSGAFLYSLEQLGEEKGTNYTEQLLTKDKLKKIWTELQAYKRMTSNKPDEETFLNGVYKNAKIPFAFNYAQINPSGFFPDYALRYNVSVDKPNDKNASPQHGMHVAGIAVANRYVPVEGDGDPKYVSYRETEHPVVGVAPDAQLVFMKVFKDGATNETNYFRAVEDAIRLGCDAINLSISSDLTGRSYYLDTTGFTINETVFDSMAACGALVACGAGNNGYYPYYNKANDYGLNYAEDIPMDTVGAPGSLAETLAVAAAYNKASTGKFASFNDYIADMLDTDAAKIPKWTTLDTSKDGSGTDIPYVFLGDPTDPDDQKKYGTEDAYKDLPENYLEGKIVLVSRGGPAGDYRDGYKAAYPYYLKHENAAAHDAKGLVVYDNIRASLMIPVLDISTATIPCVFISLASRDKIVAASEKDPETGLYTGTMHIDTEVKTAPSSQAGEMCEFSSWGTTGDLAIKPEITAPGGNIYSTVPNGYETMSGTSMATPSISGQRAVIAQRVEEEKLTEGGKNAFDTQGALVTSLLMSTAKPLTDPYNEYGLFYPVRQQGAGLANVKAATSSPAYIIMDPEATDSWASGKVKAELGDDADRTGKYTFSYTIRNISNDQLTYTLGSTVMTPEIVDDGDAKYMNTQDIVLSSDVTFQVGGNIAATVTVPANDEVKVTVTIDLSQSDRAYFAENNPKGAYVEGYISMDGEDGAVDLSVPFLAYYGNFTEPSMFDRVTINEFDEETNRSYVVPKGTVNYIMVKTSFRDDFKLGANAFAEENEFIPERNMAVHTGTEILRIHPTFIRVPTIVHTVVSGKQPGEGTFTQYWDRYTWGNAAYITYSTGVYGNQFDSIRIQATQQKDVYDQFERPVGEKPSSTSGYNSYHDQWDGKDASKADLKEGAELEIKVVAPPELYTERNPAGGTNGGITIKESELAEGAFWKTYITLDDTAPTIDGDNLKYSVDATGNEYLAVPVKDNRYTAAVLVLSETPSDAKELVRKIDADEQYEESTKVLSRTAVNQTVEDLGKSVTVNVRLTEKLEPGETYYLVAVDYAGNYETKAFTCPDTTKAATINYYDETLKDLEPGRTYTINGKDVEASTEGTIPIDPTWFGTNLTIVDTTDETGIPQLLPIPERPAAPSVTAGTTSAADSEDGSITGLETGSAYEYSTDGENWTPVEKGANSITGLGVGKYSVRFAATDSSFKSEAAEVEVTVYVAPVNPSTPSTPSGSTTPDVTTSDKTQNGETSTETTATPGASVSNGTASSQVSGSMGDEIVKQAVERQSDTVVVSPKISGSVNKSEVTVPSKTVKDLADKTDADLKVETPVGSVTLPDEALSDLGKAGDLTVTVEKKNDTVSVQVTAGGRTVEEVPGGVKTSFDLKDGEVAVVVSADGTETIIPKSLVENGTAYVLLDGSETMKIIDNSKDFEDVKPGDWFKDAVAFASSHELFNGTTETTFEPETDMSRAMLATVLWRLESEAASDGKITFPDVSSNQWYTEGVDWAADTDVITGTDEGIFQPDRKVTRQEMALMLYRYAKNVGIDTTKSVNLRSFTDSANVADWAADAMSWAVAIGLFKGDGTGRLDPTGTASRAQVATVLQRIVALQVK